MLASRPIEVQGRFLGVAVTHDTRWRFAAVHPAVEDIDGATFPTPAEARRVAELVLARGRGGGARLSVAAPPTTRPRRRARPPRESIEARALVSWAPLHPADA